MKPSLTIVLPVFNVEATLSIAVSRVLELVREAEDRFEVLLLDNGSHDDTYETASNLARRYSQIDVARLATKGGFGPLMSLARVKAHADWLCVHRGSGQIVASEILPLWRSHVARHRGRHPGLDLGGNERFGSRARSQYDAGQMPGFSNGFQILSRIDPFQSHRLDGNVSHRLDGTVSHRLDGTVSHRLDGTVSHRLDGTASHRLDDIAGQFAATAHSIHSPRLRRQMLKAVACRLRGE